jgi:hypothetical protein
LTALCSHAISSPTLRHDGALRTGSLPFSVPSLPGGLSHPVLVTGIPTTGYGSSQATFLDLAFLSAIEEVLERRIRTGDVRPLYLFAELAPEVVAVLSAS